MRVRVLAVVFGMLLAAFSVLAGSQAPCGWSDGPGVSDAATFDAPASHPCHR